MAGQLCGGYIHRRAFIMKLTHAIVLAAGLGTRMRPLNDTLLNPLILLHGMPLIDHCLGWLADAGIREAVVNTSYRAQQLEDHLAMRQSLPRVQFSREEPAPLETGGGIARALSLLGNAPFLAMNSDAVFPPMPHHPVLRMEAAWSDDLDFLMLLVPRAQTIGWEGCGDFVTDDAGRIRRPYDGESAELIFTGVEIIHPRVFAGCPDGAFSLSRLWKLCETEEGGWHSRMRAVIHDGAWLNVGDLAGLAAAENYSSSGGLSLGKRM
jgi:MurNAc alpha-1-phosphate uridylyltransferase